MKKDYLTRVSLKEIVRLKPIALVFFLSTSFFFSVNNYAQTDVDAWSTTSVVNVLDTRVATGGETLNFGAASSTSVTGITVGVANFLPVLSGNTYTVRRVNNANTTGDDFDPWYREDDAGFVEADNNYTVPFLGSFADVFAANIIDVGSDNTFNNDASLQTSNLERIDVVFSSPVPLRDIDLSSGFPVFERNGSGNVAVAAITSVDGFGNPTSYSNVVVNSGYGSTLNTSDYRYDLLTKSEAAADYTFFAPAGTQTVNGVFFSWADFGLTAGQTVYGYSIGAADSPTTPAGFLDWANFSTSSTQANSQGGADLVLNFQYFAADSDVDGDGVLDFADLDNDNDGILDIDEGSGDFDGDGVPNYLDTDSDNDGCFDALEGAAGHTLADIDLTNGGALVAAVDASGVPGGASQATMPNVLNPTLVSLVCDNDGDGVSILVDLDNDNDGIPDAIEQNCGVSNIINDFNPIWNFGTGTGADASGAGTLNGVNFTMAFNLNTGSKIFTSNGMNTAINSVVHGGNPNALLLGGNGESITYTFDSPITIVLGFDHINALDDGWQFSTPADEVVFLAGGHGITGSAANITGVKYLDNYSGSNATNVSLFKWDNITTLTISTAGAPTTTVGLNSMTSFCDADGDAAPDAFDLDSDNDGITDAIEAGGVDNNADGVIDGFLDGNQDGLDDATAITPLPIPNFDGDLVPDYLDLDADNDGLPDNVEAQTTQGYISALDTDTDGDGLDDAYDTDNGGVAIIPENTDGADNPDYLDLDSDNEGADDTTEAGIALANNDDDGDGLDDATDETPNTGYADPGGTIDDPLTSPVVLPDEDSDATLVGGNVDYRDATDDRPDSDNDGVPDVVDLDSDNDGIPDSVEQNCGSGTVIDDFTPVWNFGTGTGADATGAGTINGVNFTMAFNLGTGSKTFSSNGMNTAINSAVHGGNPGSLLLGGNGESITFTFDSPINVVIGFDQVNASNEGWQFGTPADGVVSLGAGHRVEGTLAAVNGVKFIDGFSSPNETNISLFRWDNITTLTITTTGASVTTIGLNSIMIFCDTDGDGVPNYLDLDSDNDGIPDVTEAGGVDAGDGTITGFIDLDGDGLDDATATTPLPIPNTDNATGDLLPDYLDLDSDADGISDVIEAGGIDDDGDAHVDYITAGDPATMTDTNNNGLLDALETTPLLIPNTDATGNPDYIDIDADNDGIVDNIEGQTTADYNPPRNLDADGDGLDDEYDGDDETVAGVGGGTSTSVVPTNTDGTDTPDYIDPDSDNDGDLDILEAWDTDNDGTADTDPANLDFDNDGLDDNFDDNDAVLDPTNNGQLPTDFPDLDAPGGDLDWRQSLDIDWDNDGVNDAADLDSDNDGIPDTDESGGNSPYGDADGDGIPNWLDITDGGGAGDGSPTNYADGDGNGIPDVYDADGDGVPNHLDLDSDNDGIFDIVESGQIDPANNIVDANNDGIIDAANSGTVGANGLFDPLEDGPESGNLTNPTLDSTTVGGVLTPDGIPDSNEINSDGDGCLDTIEAGFTDGDSNGLLGNGTIGAGLTVDINGLVTSGVDGYTEPDDLDSNGVYDFQEHGEAVSITTQPIDQTVTLNATANFDVVGTSPVYQWFESTNGIDFLPITNGGIYSGADTAILTIDANVLTLDGNMYQVMLSSPAYACDGNVTSIPVILNVVTDFDGDGISDAFDLDDDNDGIPDVDEGGDTLDTDNDGIPNRFDPDSDNDGVFDTNEAGFADLDLDNDGIIDGPNADFGTNGLFDGVEITADSGTINYTILNTDGDANPNFLDIDDDNDGVNTIFENPSPDGDKDPSDAQHSDTDGIPDYLDNDDDGDGVNTEFEVSNADGDGDPNTGVAVLNTDGDFLPNYLDPDDDGDGVLTIFENPNPDGDGNPNTGATQNTDSATGDLIPDYLDVDDDGDSILTIFENPDPNGDGNPEDAQNSDNLDMPDYLDVDDDNDGVYTIFENPDPNGDGNPNDAQNTDNTDNPDYLDTDDDNDNILTTDENPDPNGDGNPDDAQNSDNDEYPDYLDIDDDNDGISNLDEDVDGDGDPTNDDTDGDGNPNYLDIDDDGDGIKTITEGPGNSDDDDFPNYLDQDSDNDGIPDNVEGQPTTGYDNPLGEDTDGNGLDDAYEVVPGTAEGISPVNSDSDSDPDYIDTDSDNDTVPDSTEGHDYNADGQPDVLPLNEDTDDDGLDDAYDGSVGDFLDPNGLTIGNPGNPSATDKPADDLPNRDTADEVDYRDIDDDNDGIDTADEDGDGDGDPTNDNCDEGGNDIFPDYLDPTPCDLIPEGFSPNGDDYNDEFIIPDLAQYDNFEMEVYDRWGNIVYDYSNNGRAQPLWWDGHSSGTRTISKGEKVPVGTYYYVIRYNEDGRSPIAGWVYINY